MPEVQSCAQSFRISGEGVRVKPEKIKKIGMRRHPAGFAGVGL